MAEKAAEEARRARQRAFRERRDAAFKRNVQTYGPKKAKMIAVMIRKKRDGSFYQTEADWEYW